MKICAICIKYVSLTGPMIVACQWNTEKNTSDNMISNNHFHVIYTTTMLLTTIIISLRTITETNKSICDM